MSESQTRCMSTSICLRCEGTVVKIRVLCTKCKILYHPGCAKVHARRGLISDCCRLNYYDMILKGLIPHELPEQILSASTISTLPNQQLSDSALKSTDMALNAQASSPVTLDSIAAMMITSNQKIEAMMKKSDEKFEAFAIEQRKSIENINNTLVEFPKLVKTVTSHVQKIKQLEDINIKLATEIALLKTRAQTITSVPASGDIVIAGLPAQTGIPVDPRNMAMSVFAALGLEYLTGHIISARIMEKKRIVSSIAPGTSTSRAPLSSSTLDTTRSNRSSVSIVVALSSSTVREAVFRNMRSRRDLMTADVFGANFPGKIYIHELLPSDVYALLRQTKAEARRLNYKYTWSKNGSIFVKKSDGTPPITIKNAEDLTKLS